MTDEFDYEAFDERVHQNYEAYQGELHQTNDKKGIALLQTNYFQSCLKDSMESILQSKNARQIPIKLIVSIFEDIGMLTNEEAKIAMKICDIRDWFAHSVNLKSTEKKAYELICTIDLQIPHMEMEWDGIEMNYEMVNNDEESKYWDLYQRLDFICFDLGMTLEHEAIYHSDRADTDD